jgi:hypothetical protein
MSRVFEIWALLRSKIVARPLHVAVVGLAFLLVAASGVAGHLSIRLHALERGTAGQAADERGALIARIGRMVVLPDEEPQIATVTNPDILKGDPFFADAKAGDKLLIFSKARRAILFDPVAGVIVNAAPLDLRSTPR